MADTTAQTAAEYLIWHVVHGGDYISNLKLQKLLYYAQGWYLALEDRPLFDDKIKAWPLGPVVPGVYRRYKEYAWKPLGPPEYEPAVSDRVAAHLREIWAVYGPITAVELGRLTHEEPPWQEARGGLPIDAPSTAEIRHETMKRYFKSLLSSNAQKTNA